MKPPAKPISSPGRAEKFPPPLMRFLRSNVGSKSRGRSRSSPMFMRKKTTAIETQEPSSPKVTCMGQVRVRRSSKKVSAKSRRRARVPARRRCRWIRAALCFHCFPAKIKPNSCRTIWRRWISFCQLRFRRKSKGGKDSPRKEAKFGSESEILGQKTHEHEDEIEEEEEESGAEILMSSVSSPPKNALLLTRCRSAPYRSTSLASRFWGSPSRNEEIPEEQSSKPENGGTIHEIEKPTSQRASVSDQELRRDSEFEEEEEFLKKIEECIRDRIIKSASIERLKAGDEEMVGCSSRPLILTRCKSEPARTAEKLNPEVSFWRKRRLGIPDSCLPNNL